MSKLGSGKGVASQTCEVVINVYDFLKKIQNGTIALTGCSELDLKHHLSTATGISISTIYKIMQEGKEVDDNPQNKIFKGPKRKRPRKPPMTSLDEPYLHDIRKFTYNIQKEDSENVMLKSLLLQLKEFIDFPGGLTSLRIILKKMGFQIRSNQNHLKIIIEKPEVRFERLNYIKKINMYREQNRTIIYTDETFIQGSRTILDGFPKGQRLNVLHAGGEGHGFLANALEIFKSSREINFEEYTTWLQKKLIPNLPENSVVVLDNAPYNNVQLHPAPSSNAQKDYMLQWLREKYILSSSCMTKIELYSLIKEYKHRYREYKIDNILKAHGHDVLRLPPYHGDLNPLEAMWVIVKDYVAAQKNVPFKFESAKQSAIEKFNAITDYNWANTCEQVKNAEEYYYKNEVELDIITDNLVISVNADSESESSDFDSSDDDDLGVNII